MSGPNTYNMGTRYEIWEGKIKIVYGRDWHQGYFIYATDTRLIPELRVNPNARDVMFHHHWVDFCGTNNLWYMRACTGEHGLGTRVTLNVMRKLWTLYGVPDGHAFTMDCDIAAAQREEEEASQRYRGLID